MTKIDTKECKEALVSYCSKNIDNIIKEAYGDISHVYLNTCDNKPTLQQITNEMTKIKNWKRGTKEVFTNISNILAPQHIFEYIKQSTENFSSMTESEKKSLLDSYNHSIKTGKYFIREFDCNPFDGQLRGSVISTIDKILFVEVHGE